MKAIILKGFEGADDLQIAEVPVPEIADNEVLVQVKAISVNPVDVKTTIGKGMSGRLKNEDPLILGWDISGIVTQKGSAVTDFEVGDAVFGMVNFPGHGKVYAEYVAAPASHLALKPANISHEEAAAATLAALTALQGLTHKANVQPGQKILVHAAAGGVGNYVVQIAKHLGAYVIGTSSAANKDFVLSLSADEHVDYKAVRFEEVLHDIDLVFDAIGGDNIDRSIEVTKKGGTVISIPSGIGESVTEKAKARGIHGYFFLVESNGDDMKQIAQWLEQGIIKSHVSQVFPFDQMAAAHQQIASGRTRGKIVVTV